MIGSIKVTANFPQASLGGRLAACSDDDDQPGGNTDNNDDDNNKVTKCECGIVRNANVGYNFESAKHGEIVWNVSFPLLFSRAFCIIPLLTLLYFSEKQEEYLLNCMKIRLNGGYR